MSRATGASDRCGGDAWGSRIAAVSIDAGARYATFQYDPAFVRSGIEIAPVRMPLREQPYRFPGLPEDAFSGLPGLLADSLPDRWGTALVNAWLASQGREQSSFDVVQRLCYVGTRGVGALEFQPAHEPTSPPARTCKSTRSCASPARCSRNAPSSWPS